MQVEALYKQGRLEFLEPVRLRRDQFRLTVEVPDDVVMDADARVSAAVSPPSALDCLLGEDPGDPWLLRLKALEAEVLGSAEDPLPDLVPKQRQYLEAFGPGEDG